MFSVRIHGRGGQGAVTAAELLSVAAFDEGRHAQAFPTFGSERTGAPVVSFCRIDDRPIRLREPITDPDAVDRAGPDAAAPGEPLRGAAARRVPARQHLAHPDGARARGPRATGCLPGTSSPCPPPRSPGSTSAGRCRTPPCSAPSPPSPARSPSAAVRDAIRPGSPERSATGNARAAEAAHEHVLATADGGRPMLEQIEGSQAVARAVTLCRPEVIAAYPISPQTHIVEALSDLVRTGELASVRVPHGRVRVRRHVGVHRRLGRRRPDLHRHRPARGCCSWPRRCSTPRAWGCRS